VEPINDFINSIGKGKIIVEFFSAKMCVSVYKDLNCKAAGSSKMSQCFQYESTNFDLKICVISVCLLQMIFMTRGAHK